TSYLVDMAELIFLRGATRYEYSFDGTGAEDDYPGEEGDMPTPEGGKYYRCGYFEINCLHIVKQTIEACGFKYYDWTKIDPKDWARQAGRGDIIYQRALSEAHVAFVQNIEPSVLLVGGKLTAGWKGTHFGAQNEVVDITERDRSCAANGWRYSSNTGKA
ncbi:MAG: hypothetical protein V2B18_20055, partial [Pseudomonadota bacterium]